MCKAITQPQGEGKIAQAVGSIAVLTFIATSPWAMLTAGWPFQYPIPFYLAGVLLTATVATLPAANDRAWFPLSSSAFFLFCLMVGMSSLWTQAPAVWRTHLAWWVVCATSYVGMRKFITTRARLKRLAFAAAAAVLLTAPQLSTEQFDIHGGVFLYSVRGHNSNLTAYALMACVLIMVLVLRAVRTSGVERGLLLGAIVVAFVELVLLKGRAAQVSFLLLIVLSLLVRYLPSALVVPGILGVTTVSILISAGIAQDVFRATDELFQKRVGEVSGRETLWREARSIILANPYFGIGPGSFLQRSSLGVGVHNLFLNTLVSFGLVGFSVLIFLFSSIAKEILRGGRDSRATLLLVLCCLLPIITTGEADLIPVIWLSVACAACISEVDNLTEVQCG